MSVRQALVFDGGEARLGKEILSSRCPGKEIRNCRDFLKYFYDSLPSGLSFDATFFGRGIRHSLGVNLDLEITNNVPTSYRRGIRTTAGAVLSPPLSTWFSSESPCFYELPVSPSCDWERNFAKHAYTNMAVHGFTDEFSGRMSVFGFYNLRSAGGLNLSSILKAIAPPTHLVLQEVPTAFEREFHIIDGEGAATLTDREEEIVFWVSKGKSNQDIALILDISRYTVRNHLYNASLKLGASNRSELVSLAIQRFAK